MPAATSRRTFSSRAPGSYLLDNIPRASQLALLGRPKLRCPPRSAALVRFVALESFSQSSCDEKGVGGLLQAPDLAVSQCPEMGESGLHPPPLLRNAEIASENDHVI